MSKRQLERKRTGVLGLDEVLNGGFIAGRSYLVRGGPGTGKTTLGMHFLCEGAVEGEETLFINLGESQEQLRISAALLNLNLDGVHFLDLSPDPAYFSTSQSYDVFSPADVEREPITRQITETVARVKPKRVFIDTVTHLRYLSSDPLEFRKQIHSLLRYLAENGATVLFTSEGSAADPDDDLQYMSDGIVDFIRYSNKRILEVTKFRSSDFKSGLHSMTITEQGIEVFPKLMPEDNKALIGDDLMTSGIAELDEMLYGGLERGTITIISGPSGVGKTTLALQFMDQAAERGEHSLIYSFEESVETILRRGAGLKLPISALQERGTLQLLAVEPLLYSADEFSHRVRKDIEAQGAALVLLDSVSGYSLSIRGEDLVTHLHSLVKYLQNRGVTVILINEIQDVIGEFQVTEVGISYIADTVIFLRYLEYRGELRRAIGVLKKRLSDFEKTLREFQITSDGVKVGKPLAGLRGILMGVPEWGDKDAGLES